MRGIGGWGERRRRRRRGDPLDRGPSEHRWIVSYADFITLLFAFFTTLYGISSVDARKFGPVAAGFHTAFAGDRAGHGVAPAPATGSPAPAPPPASSPGRMLEASPRPVAAARAAPGPAEVTLEEVRTALSDRLAAPVRDGRVAVELDQRGVVVSIRESGSFATGSADVSEQAREVVGAVATAVRDIGNFVRVEGHTDDVPIHTAQYGSNWELSTARATNVVALLTQVYRIDATRLSAAGYSEFHPRAPNDSAANRARNRRVDIVILNPGISRREEPGRSNARQPDRPR
jgi:chemotaxis protein MotB